ncbi:MAG: hypothetical protein C4K60_15425 [Ideonella sp. MAG2]|nr:MAG: hypothetical protein C4K60_15425 [Ideonella sp. MAG2]
MNDLLDRLAQMFQYMSASHGLPGLNPPATEQQVAAVENVMGQKFPDDLRAAYLRFNGQSHKPEWGAGWSLFPSGFSWPTLEELLTDWQYASGSHDADAQRQAADIADEYQLPALGYFPSPQRLLVGTSGTTDFLFCDLEPGPMGKRGQIMNQSAEGADEPRVWADSFADLLRLIVDAYEHGRIEYSEAEAAWTKDGETVYGLKALKA